MRHDSALASYGSPGVGLQDRFSRVVLILFLLWVASPAWGCASRAGVPPGTVRCENAVHAKVSAAKPTVTISYTEPSVSVGGGALEDLAKTSIYYDLGRGRRLAKEVPATKPTGGGQISETITIPIESQGDQSVVVCVTATDRNGNESVPSR